MRAVKGGLGALLVIGMIWPIAASTPRMTLPPAHIEVDAPTALADQAVRIRVTGLTPYRQVVVSTHVDDYRERPWRAQATFVADATGVVDLSSDAPVDGHYDGVDGMGLFWSMDPVDVEIKGSWFRPKAGPAYRVRLSVSDSGVELASGTVERVQAIDRLTFRKLELGADGVVGVLVLPPPDMPRRVGVLAFGGSEGGMGMLPEAGLLASRGHPVLALAYFRVPGLPPTLHDIPVEYFATAARVLQEQASPEVVAMGYSRGSEAALLLAQHHPELIRGTVVYAPSRRVNVGIPGGGVAWTYRGQPIPLGDIPVDRIDGPVFAVAGADDELWPAGPYARELSAALAAVGTGLRHRVLIYPWAGHGVGTFPYRPADTISVHPLTGVANDLGGTRAGNAAAQRESWSQLLAFLADLS